MKSVVRDVLEFEVHALVPASAMVLVVTLAAVEVARGLGVVAAVAVGEVVFIVVAVHALSFLVPLLVFLSLLF